MEYIAVLGVSNSYREWARCITQIYQRIALSWNLGEEDEDGVNVNHTLSAAMMTEVIASNMVGVLR